MTILGALFFFLLFHPSGALAGEKAQIHIRVGQEPEATLDAASQATVIIPASVPGVGKSIPELLEKAAGVQIRRYGGLDDFAAVSIRGSTADQVLIYLDGILVNAARGGLTDFSFLNPDLIEKIEVYRGGSPGKVVDSTPGGVIYIHTKRKPEKKKTLLRQEAGSFFTFRSHASREEPFRQGHYRLDADYFQSRGDFPFLDDRGTRANTADDRIVNRQNNDFRAFDGTASAGLEGKRANWKAHENFFHKKEGIPGLGTHTSLRASLTTLRNFFTLQAGSPKGEKWDWKGQFFFDLMKSQFDDPLGEIGLGIQDNDDLTLRFGPQFSATLPFNHHLFSGFLAHRGEFFLPTNFTAADPEGSLSQRHMISAGLEDEMVFWDERLQVAPSARFQFFLNDLSGQDPSQASRAADNTVFDKQFSAKLGVKLSPWKFLALKSNLYRGFRQPTFGELFGDRGTLVGNPALLPEEALNVDGGVELRWENRGTLDRLLVNATLFRHDVDHLIQFLQTSQFTAKAQNLNSAVMKGAEFSLAARFLGKGGINANYVFQRATDNAPNSPTSGKFLPGRPLHQFNADLDWRWRFLKPFANVNILSHNHLDSQNLLRVDHRTILGAGVEIYPGKKWVLGAQVKNILNDRVSDVAGFPLPGRSGWAKVEIAWD